MGQCRVGPCFLFYLARTLMVWPYANSSKLFYTMTKRKENNNKGPNHGLIELYIYTQEPKEGNPVQPPMVPKCQNQCWRQIDQVSG